MGDPGELRISDADREVAAQRLHAALGEGRITLVELEERLDVVYAAKTFAQLEPPLADLPGHGPDPAGIPATASGRRAPAERLHLRTEMGTVKREGDWAVPASMMLTTHMGSIHLDLSAASSVPSRVEVEVSLGMGSVTIVLPHGATADIDGVRGSWGTVKSKVPAAGAGSAPHVVFTGKVGMGSLTVRGPRPVWMSLFS
ncbi:DUF1707 domain-containing protein [Pseudonocardia sp. KRD291]|uniref:DUF1707 SHOCT-like domain-containing protein n=1 Tax=Pseudonocardia sp. KRD291 TaxID=2792007 RepID=UPI001C49EABF|nr:DUF1707 domain-containing protein [Pseudonocardia sp. KRD291]MBW0106356.1 DUF1707 domain-containing protein [Pseudonocardia sp. KRD291]